MSHENNGRDRSSVEHAGGMIAAALMADGTVEAVNWIETAHTTRKRTCYRSGLDSRHSDWTVTVEYMAKTACKARMLSASAATMAQVLERIMFALIRQDQDL